MARGLVFAGNGTLQAADMEGWEEIAAVDASDLTEAGLRAYAIADNQTGDLAEWDPEALAKAMGPLPESMKLATGFNEEETRAIADLAFGKSQTAEPKDKGEFATIKVTREQYVIIKGASALVQKREGPDISEGRALELICADFMANGQS